MVVAEIAPVVFTLIFEPVVPIPTFPPEVSATLPPAIVPPAFVMFPVAANATLLTGPMAVTFPTFKAPAPTPVLDKLMMPLTAVAFSVPDKLVTNGIPD